jgi:hypothetical protein
MSFQRMAERRPVETVVERDDGVVFPMRGPGGGPDLPQGSVHAIVDTELQIRTASGPVSPTTSCGAACGRSPVVDLRTPPNGRSD